MPLLYPDEHDYVKCSCGSKVLCEEKLYTLKKTTSRKGETFVRTLAGIRMRCSVCNAIIVSDTQKLNILES